MNSIISPFENTDWKPADYAQLKAGSLKGDIAERGYGILENFLDKQTIRTLAKHYIETHRISGKEGGMFVSLYSQDVEYRRNNHLRLKEILHPFLDTVFKNYKASVYYFIVKAPGVYSELPLHQDLTLVDEHLFSPINIWLPLTDVNMKDGPLCVLPKSQYLFPPYRTKFTEHSLSNLGETIYRHLQPLTMRAGDLLVFDSRLIHASLPNRSGKERVAIASSVFPSHADFILLSKSTDEDPQLFDKIKISDDIFYTHKNFLEREHGKPVGELAGTVTVPKHKVTEEQMQAFCTAQGIPVTSLQKLFKNKEQRTISYHYEEPAGIGAKVWRYIQEKIAAF
jgi:hypothetical protein